MRLAPVVSANLLSNYSLGKMPNICHEDGILGERSEPDMPADGIYEAE